MQQPLLLLLFFAPYQWVKNLQIFDILTTNWSKMPRGVGEAPAEAINSLVTPKVRKMTRKSQKVDAVNRYLFCFEIFWHLTLFYEYCHTKLGQYFADEVQQPILKLWIWIFTSFWPIIADMIHFCLLFFCFCKNSGYSFCIACWIWWLL